MLIPTRVQSDHPRGVTISPGWYEGVSSIQVHDRAALRPRPKEKPCEPTSLAIAYPDLADRPARRFQFLNEAEKAHLIELDDLALVEHRKDGKIKLHQTSLVGTGAAGGALWAG